MTDFKQTIAKTLVSLMLISVSIFCNASGPLWTFGAQTLTTLFVPDTSNQFVRYTITNQSSKSHTLAMRSIAGVTQIPGPKIDSLVCGNPFLLPSKGSSCILLLQIDGSQRTSTFNGPIVCEQGSSLQCYRPGISDILKITSTPTTQYTVGGIVVGLTDNVVLLNTANPSKDSSTTTIYSDGRYTFPNTLTNNSTYTVTVTTQPTGQLCTVNNASGRISNRNVNNVIVTCSDNSHTVGGSVTGLTGESVVLSNNGGDTQTVAFGAPLNFTFPPIAEGSTYNVTVESNPTNQTCTVDNGTGTMGNAPVTNVSVVCSAISRTVGGVITGIPDSSEVTLVNNGQDSQTASNGLFNFSAQAQGSTYDVTVLSQPSSATCSVNNSTGTVTTDVNNVIVTCTTQITTLSVNPTGSIPYDIDGSTLQSEFTVTNTGAYPAFHVSAALPGGWVGVVQDVSNCSSIAAGGTCRLGFLSAKPYVAQQKILITGDNIQSPPTTAFAFTIYGYDVWSVSSTSAEVIATSDASTSKKWSTNQTLISGITETSTTLAGDACNGATDGSCDSSQIITQYSVPSDTAAYLCSSISADNSGSVTSGTWYLPAICQLGGRSQSSGSQQCAISLPNIFSNLYQLGFGSLTGWYWSSTEYSNNPANDAWIQNMIPNGAFQTFITKNCSGNCENAVRCSRSFLLPAG